MKKIKKIDYFDILLIIIVFYLLRGGIYIGNFYPVDDHYIINMLNQNISFSNLFSLLTKETEIGNFGNAGQFRPIYWLLLFIEIIIFGNNPMYYFVLRAIFLSSLVLSLYKLINLYLNRYSSFASVLLFLKMPFLGGIFNRIGFPENYAAFGLSIIIFGIIGLIKNTKNLNLKDIDINKMYFLIIFGLFINAGVKQNWSIDFFTVLLTYIFISKQINIFNKLFTFAYLFFSGLIIYSTLSFVNKTGVDFYSNEISFFKRIFTSLEFFYKGNIEIILSLLIIFLLFLVNLYLDFKDKKIKVFTFLSSYLFFRFFWEIYFFSGVLNTFFEMRFPWWSNYNFPIYLSLPVSFILLIHFIKSNNFLPVKIMENLNIFVIVVSFIVINFNHPVYKYNFFIENRNFSTSSYSSQYNKNMKELSSITEKDKTNQVIIYTNNFEDDEKYLNLDDWFKYYFIKSKIFIDFVQVQESNINLEVNRIENIKAYSILENEYFDSLVNFKSSDNCILIANEIINDFPQEYKNCKLFYLWPNFKEP